MNKRKFSSVLRTCTVAFGVAAGLVAATGCDKAANTTTAAPAAQPTHITGVLDLDKVADTVGWNAEINKDNETARAELTRLGTTFANEVLDKVKQYKAELIKQAKLNQQQSDDLYKDVNLDKLPLTKEQLNQLAIVLQNRQQYIQGVEQYATRLLQQRRVEILQSYRKHTQPIVRQVAEQAGVTVVLLKSDAIFHYADSVDITNKVTDAVRANPPKITYPSMPTMNLPTINLGEVVPTTGPATAPVIPATTRPAGR